MIRLEFVSDIDTAAGYAAHARKMLEAFYEEDLSKYGIDLRVSRRQKDPNVIDLDQRTQGIIQHYESKNFIPQVRVYFEPAHFVTPAVGIKTVSFCQWEVTRIRNYAYSGEDRLNWVKQFNSVDLVMTSCEDAKIAYEDSGVVTPIVVNSGPIFEPSSDLDPLPVTQYVVNPKTGSIVPYDERPIIIGYMAQWSPRKNIEAFIRDLTIAFNGRKDVIGLLKTYKGSRISANQEIADAAGVVRASCRVAEPPEILAIADKLTDEEIERFFQTIDIYYCPSRGEGYNVPAALAAAAGVPVIAGNYGGHRDFLDEWNLVDGSFSPCVGMAAYDTNMFWFNVDERQAISRLKQLSDAFVLLKQGDKGALEEKKNLSKMIRNHAIEKAGKKIFVKRFAEQIKSLF